jgi:hypothetical protein
MRPSPDPYVHTVGFWQHILGNRLRIRVPYALCGMWLGEEPGVEYPGPDGPRCPACASQITVRQWFRLPKAERRRRTAAFKTADAALQAYRPPGRAEDETYLRLNGRVNDLWPTVPWWCRQ